MSEEYYGARRAALATLRHNSDRPTDLARNVCTGGESTVELPRGDAATGAIATTRDVKKPLRWVVAWGWRSFDRWPDVSEGTAALADRLDAVRRSGLR